MANMSYSRFENTLHDLRECEDAMRDGDDLSSSEQDARKEMIRLCIEIAKRYGPDPVSSALDALDTDALKVD